MKESTLEPKLIRSTDLSVKELGMDAIIQGLTQLGIEISRIKSRKTVMFHTGQKTEHKYTEQIFGSFEVIGYELVDESNQMRIAISNQGEDLLSELRYKGPLQSQCKEKAASRFLEQHYASLN
jgi:hypothetical protein